MTRTSVVTQDTSSPGKGNSHESMLWAIFLMHHLFMQYFFVYLKKHHHNCIILGGVILA